MRNFFVKKEAFQRPTDEQVVRGLISMREAALAEKADDETPEMSLEDRLRLEYGIARTALGQDTPDKGNI